MISISTLSDKKPARAFLNSFFVKNLDYTKTLLVKVVHLIYRSIKCVYVHNIIQMQCIKKKNCNFAKWPLQEVPQVPSPQILTSIV